MRSTLGFIFGWLTIGLGIVGAVTFCGAFFTDWSALGAPILLLVGAAISGGLVSWICPDAWLDRG